MIQNPGIVFMGTPEFAVESLKAILEAGYPVKGVVTAPDKPAGRGLHLHPSPIKSFALKNNLPVLQPEKLKDPVFLRSLRVWNADLQVVVAFRMLPEEVWNMPPLGTFNLHASLLPQYRGAAPINWAIMNGETVTGATTFFLNHEIDKGSVIFTDETTIGSEETAGDVHDRLMIIGAALVVKTIEAVAAGKASRMEQDLLTVQGPLHPAPKIFKNDCRIDWKRDVTFLFNFIRGLSPFPTAWTEMVTGAGTYMVKVYFGRPLYAPHSLEPGTVETDGRHFMKVAASQGFISLERIQLQGKKQMDIGEFLNGFSQASQCRFQ